MVGSWFIYFHTIYIVDSYIGNYGAMARETPRLKQAVEVRESSVWHAAAGCWFLNALLNIWRLPTVFYAVYDEKTGKCV